MTTLTIEIPDTKKETFINFLREIPFVKIRYKKTDAEEIAGNEILNSIKQGMKEVKQIQLGLIPTHSIEQMFKELAKEF
ncbi:MAG: hypothetical protein RO257_16315 [Candidatus Kapabacteria bacterium]|nr:hypothetical protein [Candidatus Kapabacteria bacterium]